MGWSNITFVRGNIYYLKDGNYSSKYIGPNNTSGTGLVTIKKAIDSDRGSSTGWTSSHANQATIDDIELGTDGIVIDGSKRDENDWDNGAAYGFRIKGRINAQTLNSGGVCASNITARYIDIGTYGNPSAFYIAGYAEPCVNWTIQRNYVHDVGVQGAALHLNGANIGVVEYNWISNSWGKEAIRGANQLSNYVIRFNVLKDSCQNDGHPGSGCTAEIAIWDGDNAGDFSGNKIYGNVFQKTTSEGNSGGVIVVGGGDCQPDPPIYSCGWVGVSASNTEIYNNTIVGLESTAVGIIINSGKNGSGNICRNNLWYDVGGSGGCTANATSNNVKVTANPFDNSGKFHLNGPTPPGTTLTSPYNVDAAGVVRGSDGVWDIGAYEFGGTPSPANNPHPADTGPDGTPNNKIEPDEATTFGACWKSNCKPEATMDNAVRAGMLWNASADGEYRYDLNEGACPVCWVAQ